MPHLSNRFPTRLPSRHSRPFRERLAEGCTEPGEACRGWQGRYERRRSPVELLYASRKPRFSALAGPEQVAEVREGSPGDGPEPHVVHGPGRRRVALGRHEPLTRTWLAGHARTEAMVASQILCTLARKGYVERATHCGTTPVPYARGTRVSRTLRTARRSRRQGVLWRPCVSF